MKRVIGNLADKEFDLVIVGGGIFGVCAAWDAVLRGYKVALLEKEDFGSGASANCFKMVHGGIRYIQHGDIVRLRGSCNERSAFLRVAPHLVEPLPIVIPTYGHGMKGKEVLAAGMYAYDLLTFDRNRGISDNCRKIKWSSFFGKTKLLEQFPGLDSKGLTGGSLFYDGQMYNPPRLVLAFLRSAVEQGAEALNYAEVKDFIRDGDAIVGVEVVDKLSGDLINVRSKCVINAAGPWAEHLLNDSISARLKPAGVYSRDACFVINKQKVKDFALALQGQTSDPDALLSRPARHLFIVPWRDVNLVGVWHVVTKGRPDQFKMSEEELISFIDEVNEACPALELALDDVTMWNAGLVPFGENDPEATNLSYGKRSRLLDHQKEHNVSGLITLIGIRYTMGRADAQIAVNMAEKYLGGRRPNPNTDWEPVYGGDFESFEQLTHSVSHWLGTLGSSNQIPAAIAHNYGSKYIELTNYRDKYPGIIDGSDVLQAEVAHAVHEEMAVTLADVVFRRTNMGTAQYPGRAALEQSAGIMAEELSWSEDKCQSELHNVESLFAYQARGG